MDVTWGTGLQVFQQIKHYNRQAVYEANVWLNIEDWRVDE
jgi:hypothetical protein